MTGESYEIHSKQNFTSAQNSQAKQRVYTSMREMRGRGLKVLSQNMEWDRGRKREKRDRER